MFSKYINRPSDVVYFQSAESMSRLIRIPTNVSNCRWLRSRIVVKNRRRYLVYLGHCFL